MLLDVVGFFFFFFFFLGGGGGVWKLNESAGTTTQGG